MWKCNKCNTENEDKNGFCIECGYSKSNTSENHCSNPNCKAYNTILSNPEQKHCGKCGAATTYWKQIEDLV